MKPIFTIYTTDNLGHKVVNYNATVFELLKVLDLTPEFLLEQSHCSNYFIIGIEFKDGEFFPVKNTVNCSDETFVNAVLVKMIGNGSECNCDICYAFSHQDDEDKESLYSDFNHTDIFMDFYKSNFEDDYFLDLAYVTDSLEDSLQEVMEGSSGFLVNSQTSRFGDTHVGTENQFKAMIRECFLSDIMDRYPDYLENEEGNDSEDILSKEDFVRAEIDSQVEELSEATWEDTFRFPHLDE